jgi:transcriptional regulator with XRE-family HTH domain
MGSTLEDRVRECMRRSPALSQADIARATGVKTPSVADWLNGKTKSLKAETARRAAALFQCDQNWLATGVGQPNWGLAGAGTASPATPPTLEAALERLSIELARDLADDVRQDVADALHKLAMRRGAERDQHQVAHLLATPPSKRQRAA